MGQTILSSPLPLLLVVAAALVDDERRVLVQRRLPGTPHAGLWEFPGGKIEDGESPEAALVRELGEELGIRVDAASLVPACFASEHLEGRHLLLLVYICRAWHGTPEPLQATELRWLPPRDLHSIGMPPADRPLIALLDALL